MNRKFPTTILRYPGTTSRVKNSDQGSRKSAKKYRVGARALPRALAPVTTSKHCTRNKQTTATLPPSTRSSRQHCSGVGSSARRTGSSRSGSKDSSRTILRVVSRSTDVNALNSTPTAALSRSHCEGENRAPDGGGGRRSACFFFFYFLPVLLLRAPRSLIVVVVQSRYLGFPHCLALLSYPALCVAGESVTMRILSLPSLINLATDKR